jgi:hypothetical protein
MSHWIRTEGLTKDITLCREADDSAVTVRIGWRISDSSIGPLEFWGQKINHIGVKAPEIETVELTATGEPIELTARERESIMDMLYNEMRDMLDREEEE